MKFNEAKKIQDFYNEAKKVIEDFHTIAGVEAVRFFTENFRKQGFEDSGVTKWKQRKREDRVRNRAILVKSGALRRSLIKKRAGKLSVYIISPLPYASRHNEGLKGMPERRFVGEIKILRKKIYSKMENRLNRAFNK